MELARQMRCGWCDNGVLCDMTYVGLIATKPQRMWLASGICKKCKREKTETVYSDGTLKVVGGYLVL